MIKKLILVTAFAVFLNGCEFSTVNNNPNTGNSGNTEVAPGELPGTSSISLLGPTLLRDTEGQLTESDFSRLDEVAQHALERAPIGKESKWTNPETGVKGTLTPTRTFKSSYGLYCRDYAQSITVEKTLYEGIGTACRVGSGTWRFAKK